MLAIVELNTDTLHDALESLDTILIPWLESRAPSLSEEDIEREYVKMALQIIDQYDPDLDEAKRTYYVYQLVTALKELARSPNLQDTVTTLRAEPNKASASVNEINRLYSSIGVAGEGKSSFLTKLATGQGLVYVMTQKQTGRLPELPKGQPLRERPQVRYDVTPNPTDR